MDSATADLFADAPAPTGEDLKREGQRRVAAKNEAWRKRVLDAARMWCRTRPLRVFRFEEMRFGIDALCGEPTHPNAWSTIPGHLVRTKLIEPTGEYEKSKHKAAKARVVPTYRVL